MIHKQAVAEIGAKDIKNPHVVDLKKFTPMCNICHQDDPLKKKEPAIFSKELSEICQSCHQKIPLSCREATTQVKTGILIEQIPDLVLKTTKGSLTCDSCHLVHAEPGRRMKQEYYLFLKQAEKINPHRAGIFCIFCHDKEPLDEEDPLYLKFKGDRVLICTQCHNNERARADNHPVNIYPSEGRGIIMDERFPLYDGKVTCLTCHDIRCQGGEVNPKFLRGWPYETRVDACLVCHQRESYQAVNPHELIDENGLIRKDRCLYCHYIGPSLKN